MYSTKLYTLDVGVFNARNGSLYFDPAQLRLPLTINMPIGRQSSEEEQDSCTGDVLGNFNTGRLEGPVYFLERPAYNGSKVIIPDNYVTHWISRHHGEFERTGDNFLYRHRSQTGMNTRLWLPDKGAVKRVSHEGEEISIDFPEKDDPPSTYWFLLGGKDDADLGTAFSHASYYAAVHMQISGDQLPETNSRQYVNITLINGAER
ncbi:MAG: hypothetical protein HY514_00735 [Candidatus Aenigmarchaeota archaeon]|nr:hypothetical protein [Candidatus Aenigmarchaeota archaeon]